MIEKNNASNTSENPTDTQENTENNTVLHVQPVTPQNQSTPMFNRSVNGQYSVGQPNFQPPYTAPTPTTAQFPQPQKRKPLDRPSMRMGDAVGMPFCMFFIGSYVLQFAIMLILSIISPTANNIFSDSNVVIVTSSLISLVVLTVPYLYTLKVTNSSLAELISVKKVSATKTIGLIMAGMGVTAVGNITTNILSSLSEEFFDMPFESSVPEFGTDIWSFILMMLCVGILPAVVEEFAIRGVVLGVLRKRFSDASAIVISSIAFSLLHGNLQQIPFAFLVGIVLSYATVYSGSIIPAVIIHGLNNSISVLLSFAALNMSPMVLTVVNLLYFSLCLLLGICGFILLSKTDSNAFKLSSERSENTEERFKGFFGSGWMIAFIILSIVQTLLVQGIITE